MRENLMRTRFLKPTLLALLLFVAAGTAFAIDPNALYHITAKHSGKCLAVRPGPGFTENYAGVVQWDCIESDSSQKWQIIPVDNYYYKIIARHSGKGLETHGGVGEVGNGVTVQQWDYVGAANQKWRLIPVEDGYYQIVASHSGRSLDVNAGPGVTGNGAIVQQWEYWGGDNQKWRLTVVGSAIGPPAPTNGRFRVTLTGFTVNAATVDGLLVGDGQGDEVYTATEVAELSSSGRIVGAIRSHESLTYGDTSADHGLPPRIKAGDINPTTGGLQAGNSYPRLGDPPPILGSGSSLARSIPMIIWEGELRGGPDSNAVVILPTIWELDNDQVMFRHWREHARLSIEAFARRRPSMASPLITVFEPLTETIDRNDFDHPIGIQGDAFVPFTLGSARFIPLRVFLTLNSAQAAADATSHSFAQGRGVVQITYEDGERYGRGSYTIFLRVERLP